MRCEGEKTYAEPGNCPVCNMKLELVADDLVQTSPPNQQVLSRQATTKLQQGNGDKTFTAPGYIVPAQNRNRSIAARFGGRLDKLYVKFNNQYVRKGDKIMDIYSPELAKIQEEHLFLLRSEGMSSSLLERSRVRLRLLGITESQIALLEKNKTVALTVSVYSPANGYVVYNLPTAGGTNSAEISGAMEDQGARSMEPGKEFSDPSMTQLQEGMYVNEGQTIFTVNDLKEVWALVSLPHEYVKLLPLNEDIELISESNPSKKIKGRILLIEPTFEEAAQRFIKARILVHNENDALKINSLVKMHVNQNEHDKTKVPSSAVYKTGLNAYVWVKADSTEHGTGIFRLRRVMAGASDDGMTIIQSGLLPDEEIAMHAGMMVDSETFLSVQ